MNDSDVWPAGQTWVFQGTVAEDATAGTHVCSLTVTPGAGNELDFRYGMITIGVTGTSQTVQCFIDDGTNFLTQLLNIASTVSGSIFSLPVKDPQAAGGNIGVGPNGLFIVSGTMRLILKVQTTAVSVTQTFSVVCRIRGPDVPAATLADTVGTPTLTTNTNGTF